MWNPKKYHTVLDSVKKEGTILHQKVTTKEQIYEALGKELGYSTETVKSWGRPTSNGPTENDVIAYIEKILGVSENELGRRSEKIMNVTKPNIQSTISDFNKKLIYDCYKEMKDYLHSDDVESEDRFCEMYNNISKCEIAVPAELFKKIDQFVDDNLAPIVYDRKETFKSCYTEDIGSFNEDGVFCTRDEESTHKLCMNFMLVLFNIEQKVEDFAKTDLSPYLLG